ncbi:hypothetical protein JMX53_07315 [Cutibacterium avidum]|uniref:hypothetical protein n=1 Tax=Cutibacterium avidum TaxID=33010 RepID=UPI00192CA991|nr:hypothetical protein [Cutibacterium avidum]QQY14164.1 hypothetical protein JMX53_07315 [Cutibacterium avidum]
MPKTVEPKKAQIIESKLTAKQLTLSEQMAMIDRKNHEEGPLLVCASDIMFHL